MIVSQGTSMIWALPYTMIPTGRCFESLNSLLTVLKIFWLRSPPIVTALSAAKATAALFKMAISAVMALVSLAGSTCVSQVRYCRHDYTLPSMFSTLAFTASSILMIEGEVRLNSVQRHFGDLFMAL